ncbi:hypothetical protein Nos7524_1783 [Nostoc sp. PCC 7524]|uniref:hypothetical protein n=1 Tax=Nostoc sp. (strain ATCC 29411 / PCC 7524) TaxID=28072 RepID=UPI00029EFCC3|nr:hypothetical protein [Nostoc sp. PCC 7524]AFY47649.1 hypothetical protein Nos7524_1783 [Nostoc sp. PCC 7524]
MNLVKLFLLVCPVILSSILLAANPANASIKSTSVNPGITVEYVQPLSEIAAPHLTPASNPITEQLGCTCANCVQSKFQLLQGKLPSVDF